MEKEKQAAEKQKGIDALNENLKKIHELANQPMKCSIDEVAAAYFQSLRVENYEVLGEEFGGYKLGRIYLFVLDLLSKHIDDTMNARQISRDYMTRETGKWLKCAEQGVERCPIKDSPYYGKTIKEILEDFSKKICKQDASKMFDDEKHTLEKYEHALDEIKQIVQAFEFDSNDKSVNRLLANRLKKVNDIIKEVKEEK